MVIPFLGKGSEGKVKVIAMDAVLLVDVDAETAAALRRGMAGAGALIEAAQDQAAESIRERRATLGAVVVGAGLERPLSVAQQIHAVDRDLLVFILCHPWLRAELEHLLRFTPLGGEAVCRSSEEAQALGEELRAALARTRQRRSYRSALAEVETQLRALAPRPRRVQYLERLLDSVPIGVAVVDRRCRVLDWNRMAGLILEKEAEAALGTSLAGYFPGEEGVKLAELVARCPSVRRPLSGGALHRKKTDGTLQCVEATVACIDGDDMEALVLFEDVTQRKRAEERQALAEKVFAHTSEAILITDRDNRILSVNPAFAFITGYSASEVIGQNPRMLKSGRHDEAFYQRMWDSLIEQGSWAGQIWDKRKNGEIYPKWLTINAVYEPGGGRPTHYVAIFSDITDRQRSEERIQYLAYHDALTELPNRFALHAQLPQIFATAQREGTRVAVLFLDLDRFKTINDSLGHHVGDELLIEAARRIGQTVRESDTVARLGGDEFVIVLPNIGHPAAAASVAAKILANFQQPVTVGNHSLYTSASIGISFFPGDSEEIGTILKNADMALYHAKAQGRDNFQFFSGEMNLAATERLALENRLREALGRDELDLHYQPQMDARDGALSGVEALAHWQPAGREAVPPGRFIPIAEECGLISALGEWVLKRACREMQHWLDLGLPPVRLAVNLSALQLRDKDLPDRVAEVLWETKLDPHLLELEVTESAVMGRPDEAIGILNSLKEMGITLAIDDFGTGYSSLAYLRRLPIDRLKIDQSFIAEIERSPNDAVISQSAIALGHSLGLKVLAEGVETAGQLDWLLAHGCDETQGYYWSPPLPAAAAAEFIGRWAAKGAVWR